VYGGYDHAHAFLVDSNTVFYHPGTKSFIDFEAILTGSFALVDGAVAASAQFHSDASPEIHANVLIQTMALGDSGKRNARRIVSECERREKRL
jgi:hypothetical protein